MSLDSTANHHAQATVPTWLKQSVAALVLIASSVGGTLGVVNTSPEKPAASVAVPVTELQAQTKDLSNRITALERNADAQNRTVQHIAETMSELVAEQRNTSRQVERMIGTLEEMQR